RSPVGTSRMADPPKNHICPLHRLGYHTLPHERETQQDILTTGLLQFADTLAYWSSTPSISPMPSIIASYGPVLTSLVIRIIGATALVFVLNSLRKNPAHLSQEPSLQHGTVL